MRLSLTGMSGSGKSYWSSRLAEIGFRRYCCDDLIAAKLASELKSTTGRPMDLGEWMGFPFDPHYAEREAMYLAWEIQVVNEILDELEHRSGDARERIVIDTTGSVIYTGEETLTRLRRNTTVAHISTPPEVQRLALDAYIEAPRPVLWHGFFNRDTHESNREALARCYPVLLSSRERLYRAYADVTIDYQKHHKRGFRVEELLGEVFKDAAGLLK